MAGYKGTPLVHIRQWLRAAPDKAEQRVLDALTPEDRAAYQSVVATAWVPVDVATRIYVAAAPVMHPGEPTPLRTLGRALATEMLGGVFRFLVRLVSVESLMDRTAVLWRNFHDLGTARTVRLADNRVILEVVDHPLLPDRMQEVISGWIAQAVELTGAKNVLVAREGNASCWKWVISWR